MLVIPLASLRGGLYFTLPPLGDWETFRQDNNFQPTYAEALSLGGLTARKPAAYSGVPGHDPGIHQSKEMDPRIKSEGRGDRIGKSC